MLSVRGSPAVVTFSLLTGVKSLSKQRSTGAVLKYIFQRPMPFGWSQLQRATYLFNQSRSCWGESPAPREEPGDLYLYLPWAGSPHLINRLLQKLISKTAAQNRKTRSGSATEAGVVTNVSWALFWKKQEHTFHSLQFLGCNRAG